MTQTLELLWITNRGERHQQSALRAAPPGVHVSMCRNPDEMRLYNLLHHADVLISERGGSIDSDDLAQAPRLKLIVRLGSLTHDIDLEACQARGIAVSRQPVIGSILVAEHIVMMILTLVKRLNETQSALLGADHGLSAVRSGEDTFSYNWNRLSGIGGLIHKTVAITGMGEIGVELARRLQPFHPAAILYHKRTRYPADVEASLSLHYASPENCYQQADFLVNLLPYSPETELSINASVFSQMKSGSFVVHAGSGSTLHESDLVDAIVSGRLSGAALDTYEYEPFPVDHPLIALVRDPKHNLILTPHIAGGSSAPDRREDYAEVERFRAGESLHFRII